MAPNWFIFLAAFTLASARVAKYSQGQSIFFQITVDKDEEPSIDDKDDEPRIENSFDDSDPKIVNNMKKLKMTHNKQVKNVDPINYNEYNYAKPTDQMIAEAGYPVETHTVITPDGYILRIHRIPHAKSSNYSSNATRPLVFLQHGLLSSSADWVLTGPDNAPAFYFADNGYDVWLGNFRGNIYSQDHVDEGWKMDGKYWHFSWDQMAQYDLPTMLKHAMDVTGQDKFYYIGHSMGTLSYFTACNYHPWIPAATRLMVGYGAHTVVEHMTSPMRLFAPWANDLQWIAEHIGLYQFKPNQLVTEWFAEYGCSEDMKDKHLCTEWIFLIYGYNKHEMNSTDLPYILCHVGGTSTQTLVHYAQSINKGGWQGFDWGSDENNLGHWNSTDPPKYKYQDVQVPVALFWAQNDILVVPEDEKFVAAKLPNLVTNSRVPEDHFTHTDFLWGIHSADLVYKPTIQIMQKY